MNCVYHSKAACVEFLQAVERLRPSWWTPPCAEFLRRVECTPTVSVQPGEKILVVLEGLDGVGKSVVANSLLEKLGGSATLLRTPDPGLSDIRKLFREQQEETVRAFYSAANYLAAWDALNAIQERRIVLFDRWWCSTCAMALANRCKLATLPVASDAVYRWPHDLPPFQLGVLLYVDEHIRQARIRQRAPEDAEERRLSAQQEMRAVAMEAYRRFGLLTDVQVATYGVAVNRILALMTEKGLPHSATPFTEEELAEMSPF
ncbi:UMP-CMP kinase 2, mitochondrial [Trypanosoma rangeli]|uniref:UMP-CMP kinase 2, mitochondrial n=1 Tax=Trypanosoma rangeli TaxID=5698 RepID=A0A422NYA0_TRYRA|nr:UMP-CMP kinase 2, mitochondrial [Trypanosoma rangeli]RNF10428.1 UMP-CMP kinase 2, mitochondrial [Trypanosoma rangeli]|eukprot:RNF10428.1 UMP-CMP kinase 2, mitochondrial [Trypanosoma rangeli]